MPLLNIIGITLYNTMFQVVTILIQQEAEDDY